MNQSYQTIVLGNEAREYIRQNLSRGNTLTKLLFENLTHAEGKITVAFPNDIRPKDLDKFKYGGKIPSDESKAVYKDFMGNPSKMVPISTFRTYLVETIEKHLKADFQNICVFEDTSLEPNYPWFQPVRNQYFFYGDEVYHFIQGSELTYGDVESSVKLARSWLPEVGILTDTKDLDAQFIPGGSINLDSLQTMVNHARAMSIEAYDHETFLIWDFNSAI